MAITKQGDSTMTADRQRVVARAINRKIRVPDILSLMPGWLSELQPDVEKVNIEIDQWLKT